MEEFLKSGLLLIRGAYWDADVVLVGRAVGAEIPDGTRYLRVAVSGTKSEALLRYLSGVADKRLLVHLCGPACPSRTWQDGVVHGEKVSQWTAAQEDWMTNCQVVAPDPPLRGEDELEEMRREAARAGGTPGAPLEGEGGRVAKEAEKKEKKKEKEKEKKKKDRKPVKVKGKKDLEDVFGATGLDPDPEVRGRMHKKGRKILKNHKKEKKKKSKDKEGKSSSSQGSTGGTSEEEESSTVGTGVPLFDEQTGVKRVARGVPGLLTANFIAEAQEYLMNSQGLGWSAHKGEVPPLATQYFRNQLQPRMGGAMSREYQTLAYCVDQCLQGQVALGVDCMIQRMKALASIAGGVHFSVAQKLEILPAEKVNPASLEETQQAAQAARREEKVFGQANRGPRPWQPSSFGGEPGGQGRGRGSGGKGKKGKGKDQKGKEDGNKGGDAPKK